MVMIKSCFCTHDKQGKSRTSASQMPDGLASCEAELATITSKISCRGTWYGDECSENKNNQQYHH